MSTIRIYVIVLGFAFVSLFSSCGSGKSAAAKYPDYTGPVANAGSQRVEELTDECNEMEKNAPENEMRASSSAISANRDFGMQQAELFARGILAARIEALTMNVMKGYRGQIGANEKVTNEEDIKQDVAMFSEQTLRNCKVVCSKVYRLANGKYECLVCLSVPMGEVEKVVGATVLSDDERMKVEFNAKVFRNSYTDELKAFREKQLENR